MRLDRRLGSRRATALHCVADGALRVPGLNTIRHAQQLLVDDGLIETRQGVGTFVLRVEPQPRPVDVLAELRAARAALNTAHRGPGQGRCDAGLRDREQLARPWLERWTTVSGDRGYRCRRREGRIQGP